MQVSLAGIQSLPLQDFSVINPEKLLQSAFMNHSQWIPFFHALRNRSPKDKISLIHDAMTVSVASCALTLLEKTSFPLQTIYLITNRLFNSGNLKLSGLIDLSSPKSFERDIMSIQSLCIANSMAQMSESAGTPSTGIGTLPLFV
jgi:hypothetical protein